MNNKLKAVAVSLVALSMAATGCSKKHGDLPAPLGVTTPPNVTNLDVSNPQNFDYDVSWSIGDPSAVEYYRVYYSYDGTNFALARDSVAVSPALFTAPLPVASFGVTVVGHDFVEGAMVTKDAP